jgi:hypothetical protein
MHKLSKKIIDGVNQFTGFATKQALVQLIANLTMLQNWHVSVANFSEEPSVVLKDNHANAVTIVQITGEDGGKNLIFSIGKTDEDIYTVDKIVDADNLIDEIYHTYLDWQMVIG